MNRSLFVILLIVFIDVLGFTIVIPLLPFYAERFNARPATIGLLISVYALCGLFSAPLLGRWSDRIGRKPVLALSQIGTLLSFVALALAPSLVWVFAARILDGLTAGNVGTARAYISDVTPPRERTQAFGKIAAAFSFGYLVGPGAAGALAKWSPTLPIWAAAGVSALSVVLTLFLLPGATQSPARPASNPHQSSLQFLSTPVVGIRLWQMFGFLLAFSCFTSGFALFCERRLRWNGAPLGAAEVGMILAYIGFFGLLTQLLALRRLVDWLGETRLVKLGFALAVCAYAALASTGTMTTLLLCLSFSGFANSLLRPCLLGLISQNVGPQRQGEISGLTQSLQSLAMIIGPLLAGGLIEWGWLSAWALTCGIICLGSLTLPYWRR